jgi:hypothetical protein
VITWPFFTAYLLASRAALPLSGGLCTGFAMLPVVEAFERIPRRFAGFDNERRESDGIAVTNALDAADRSLP